MARILIAIHKATATHCNHENAKYKQYFPNEQI